MTKYKEYFLKMVEQNKALFDEFGKLHDQYASDEDRWQEKFNSEGKKIMTVIREWEDRLCGRSEANGYGSFTGGLAEKFQSEVRKMFPLIDRVGIKVSSFNIKKINL